MRLMTLTSLTGLNDKNGEQGEFEWSDNSDVEYSFWGSGEPDDWGGDKDCSLLFHSLESGWNDENCRYSQPYICKKRKGLLHPIGI